jgi:hypothetical protein
VREGDLRTIQPHQVASRQLAAGIGLVAGQRAQVAQIEALPEDRRCLDRTAIRLRQAVEPRQHNAVHRWRQVSLLVGRAAAQQLFQEQRVALRAFHAPLQVILRFRGKLVRQLPRVVAGQRPEIDGRQQRVARAPAPGGIDRVAIEPRRHEDQGRAVG